MVDILIFLNSENLVNNFLNTNIFLNLIKKYHTGFCISKQVPKKKVSGYLNFIKGQYKINNSNESFLEKLDKISILANSNNINLFKLLVEIEYFGSYSKEEKELANKNNYKNYLESFENKLEENKSLIKVVKKNKPKLIIVPIGKNISTNYELIKLSKKYNYKIMFLLNGSDNLCSYYRMPTYPNYIGVWGEISKQHASKIQKIPEKNIFKIGCSRIDSYINKEITFPFYNFRYILFTGTSIEVNELKMLKILDNYIIKKELNLKVVYKPYPNIKNDTIKKFFEKKYKNVFFDYLSLKKMKSEKDYKNEFNYYEINSDKEIDVNEYFKNILFYANFLIGPISTINIEAALLGIPSIILAYDDGSKIPPNKHIKFDHFIDCEKIDGWFFIKSKSNINDSLEFNFDLLKFENNNNRNYSKSLRKQVINKYIHIDEKNYGERLLEKIDSILIKQSI